MKQELVQLAKDKGFVATFVHDKPFIYSSKEPLRWLFWMTELQKWLREIHNIHLRVIPSEEDIRYYDATVITLNTYNPDEWLWNERFIYYDYDSYEECLEDGLLEALKLLKDESKK